MVGEHVVLVGAVAGIDEEVEAPVGVLHLRQKVGLPVGDLQQVAPAVAALGKAEVIQVAHARGRRRPRTRGRGPAWRC